MFALADLDASLACPTLPLTDALFHEALDDGEGRYHVEGPRGISFDIVHLDNSRDLEPAGIYPAYVRPPYMAAYARYDEHDADSLYLGWFEGYRALVLEEANEYTVALAKVALAFTDLDVWCPDARLAWFVEEDARLHLGEPPAFGPGEAIFVTRQFSMGLRPSADYRISATYAFHNVFVLQWLLDGRPLSQFSYVHVPFHPMEGIASLVANARRYQRAFGQLGLRLVAGGERMGPYPTAMLERYFTLALHDEGATAENTLRVPDQAILSKTKLLFSTPNALDASVLSPEFRDHIETYREAVFGTDRMLGVLMRGTDYLSSGFTGARKQATVDEMLPLLRQWMAEDGYDRIFLATEDADILARMRSEFGDRLIAIAQRRHSASELSKGQVLVELAGERAATPEELDEELEETVVNYFYALYLLSRCESLVCSGQTNGFDVVRDLNAGAFRRIHKFQVGLA